MITISRNCEHCGEVFVRNIYPSQDKPRRYRFCSMSCSRSGTPASEDAKRSMSESGLKRWGRSGEKEQQSVRLTEMHADPINKTAHRLGLLRSWDSESRRREASISAKSHTAARQAGLNNLLKDPVKAEAYSKRLRAAMKRPDVVEKLSVSNKAWWRSLTEEQKNQKNADRFRGLLPYLNSKKRTAIELMTETALLELGIDFIAQYPVDCAVLDFYIPSLKLGLECDGSYWHSLPGAKDRDRRRDWWLRSLGYSVVRMSETDIKKDCLEAVTRAIAVGSRRAMSEAI